MRAFKVFAIVPLLLMPSFVFAQSTLKVGDIIFQTSRSSQSKAIQEATHSEYSHMGVVLFREGKPCVFEAIAKVGCTELDGWIKRGVGKHYVVKRLKKESGVSEDRFRKLEAVAKTFTGLPYDLQFLWSDSKMYCSELVWKMYERAFGLRIGSTGTFRDFDLSSSEVTRKMKERYGDSPPYQETVVSPQAIFDSPLLEEVERG